MAARSQLSTAVLLLGLLLLVGPLGAAAFGTVVFLYNVTNAPKNVSAQVVAPTPLKGTPAGCVNLPSGFAPKSAVFAWNLSYPGAVACSYVVFFLSANCQLQATGGEPAIKAAASNTTINNLASSSTYTKIQRAKSVGCSFAQDPCKTYGCNDTNAACISSGFNVTDSGKSLVANNTLDCSTCKTNYTKVAGKCKNLCANVSCPSVAPCAYSTGACTCPLGLVFNPSSQLCSSASLWLPLFNNLRLSVNSSLQNITWNATMENRATAWAANLSSTQCGAAAVNLTKIPSSGLSETDTYLSYSTDEVDAFNLWNPAATTTARIQRIISPKTTQTGCGKAPCGSDGAFFTCLFYPFTF